MAETVAIVGAGAMAQLYAALLQQHQITPIILRRPNAPSQSVLHQIQWLNQPIESLQIEHQAADVATKVDAVLVLTKAQDAVAAVIPVLNWLPPHTPLVLLHNGMGPQQQLAKQYPNHNIWAGSVSDGADRIAKWQVAQRGTGFRKAGALNGQTQLPPSLAALGFEKIENINAILWHKLTINAVINPICGRDSCTNGELLKPCYQQEIAELCQELGQLAQAANIDDDSESCLARVRQVATATANNRCSTVQDIAAKRPTELQHISGYLLQQAHQVGLNLPNHQRLYDYHQQQGHISP